MTTRNGDVPAWHHATHNRSSELDIGATYLHDVLMMNMMGRHINTEVRLLLGRGLEQSLWGHAQRYTLHFLKLQSTVFAQFVRSGVL